MGEVVKGFIIGIMILFFMFLVSIIERLNQIIGLLK
jgi:hypothetical protein